MEPSHPITEDDIANFLVSSPDFFVRHADVLSAVTIASPHGARAVSLQERQAEMLRAKIKALEQRIVEMMRNAHDNMVLADKLEQLACELLRVGDAALLPGLIAAELETRFDVPQVAIRLWNVAGPFARSPFALDAGEDAKAFASSLKAPYCGVNPGFEFDGWLDDPQNARSLALVPLRFRTRAELARQAASQALRAAEEQSAPAGAAADALADEERVEPSLILIADGDPGARIVRDEAPPPPPACGLLVLASDDPKRFQSGMGTEFLERLSDLAGAALSRLAGDAA